MKGCLVYIFYHNFTAQNFHKACPASNKTESQIIYRNINLFYRIPDHVISINRIESQIISSQLIVPNLRSYRLNKSCRVQDYQISIHSTKTQLLWLQFSLPNLTSSRFILPNPRSLYPISTQIISSQKRSKNIKIDWEYYNYYIIPFLCFLFATTHFAEVFMLHTQRFSA